MRDTIFLAALLFSLTSGTGLYAARALPARPSAEALPSIVAALPAHPPGWNQVAQHCHGGGGHYTKYYRHHYRAPHHYYGHGPRSSSFYRGYYPVSPSTFYHGHHHPYHVHGHRVWYGGTGGGIYFGF